MTKLATVVERVELSEDVREARSLAGKEVYKALQRAKRPEAVHG
jgi:hypothetical protein